MSSRRLTILITILLALFLSAGAQSNCQSSITIPNIQAGTYYHNPGFATLDLQNENAGSSSVDSIIETNVEYPLQEPLQNRPSVALGTVFFYVRYFRHGS